MDHYIHVFFESLWTASLVPFGNEPTLAAMQAFGGFNMPIASAIATIGATLGQMFNWWIGLQLITMHLKNPKHITPSGYERARHLFNHYAVFLLLFSWAPLCKLLPLAAGFLGTKFRLVLPLVLMGEAAYYIYPLL